MAPGIAFLAHLVRQWLDGRRDRRKRLIVEKRDQQHRETCAQIDRDNARRRAEGWPDEALRPYPSRYVYFDGL